MMHDSKCGCPNCVRYGLSRAYKKEEPYRKLQVEDPFRFDLRPQEPHPMSHVALEAIVKWGFENQDRMLSLREAFSTCALNGNRTGQICGETLRRFMSNEPVSDRYLLGLYCYLKEAGEI